MFFPFLFFPPHFFKHFRIEKNKYDEAKKKSLRAVGKMFKSTTASLGEIKRQSVFPPLPASPGGGKCLSCRHVAVI